MLARPHSIASRRAQRRDWLATRARVPRACERTAHMPIPEHPFRSSSNNDRRRATRLSDQGLRGRRPAGELRPKLERVGHDRHAARRQGRLRSHGAGPAPGPHRAHPQDEALPGSRPHRGLRRRRLHRADRRSDRPVEDAAAADAGGDRAERRDLQDAGLQDPRSAEDRGALQQRVAEPLGSVGWVQAGRQLQRRADARAPRFQAALRERASRSRCTSSCIRWRRRTTRCS